MPLTSEQVKIVKSTVPVLETYGAIVTAHFYSNMLRENPELKNIFNTTNQTNGHQSRALAGAVYAYAAHIDDLGALSPAVQRICHKHASLYIRPDQYEIVGKYLLGAFQEVLGDAFTPEVRDAWAAAYWQLAKIMIDVEENLYREADGWTDWRNFRLDKKVPESEEITSFYLTPEDGKPLPLYKPGQYISVRVKVPGLQHYQCRQYSLSDSPGNEYYRISVKKDQGLDSATAQTESHPGLISNHLHNSVQVGDIIQVSCPKGDFYLEETKSKSPIVLISAGVGLTPLLSMLNTLASTDSDRPIHWIHATHSRFRQAFRAHVQTVAKSHDNVRVTVFNKLPSDDDVLGRDYHYAGRIDLNRLDRISDLHLDNKSTEYFVCGPTTFMTDTERVLLGFGVDASRIHVELFGTGGVPPV
ncbi:globin-like protein [Lipomyces chichibuensis]|uniref:globin-like protein n=1 Tax=Lipomyces chichibuensis TaxID=1546026 RepID=UPI0033433E64